MGQIRPGSTKPLTRCCQRSGEPSFPLDLAGRTGPPGWPGQEQAPGTAPGHHRPRVPTRRASPGDRNKVALARGERSGSRAGRR